MANTMYVMKFASFVAAFLPQGNAGEYPVDSNNTGDGSQ
jgi:hypothetical protein